MELTQEILDWIQAHYDEDVTRLRLKYHDSDSALTDFMILQIECRKKASNKLAKTLKNEKFIFPTSLSVEQCTSDDLAEIHSKLIVGNSILDMTCGLGIDVFAIARNKQVNITAVEIVPEIAYAARLNAISLGLNNITIVNEDCIKFLYSTDIKYDTIFIDPARRGKDGRRLYALCDCEPNVISILPELKKHCSRLVIKASPMLDVTQIIRELGHVNDIYILGTLHECKEIVAVIDFDKPIENTMVHATTIDNDGIINETSFSINEEYEATATYNKPIIGGYLYEPYPSVMKAAPMKLLSQQQHVQKLHTNTHLFTSETIMTMFPGKCFLIEDIIPFSSKTLKYVKNNYPIINISTRNFILSADELKKKLKIKDGGENRLFGVTTINNQRILIITSPLFFKHSSN